MDSRRRSERRGVWGNDTPPAGEAHRGDDEAAIQDTVGDDAATFTLTFNEVERHIACRWPSAGPAYFFLPAPCFCESAEPATLLTGLELFGLLSAFAAFDATGLRCCLPVCYALHPTTLGWVSTPLRQAILLIWSVRIGRHHQVRWVNLGNGDGSSPK